MPEPAANGRKRSVPLGSGNRRRGQASSTTDPSTCTPQQRVDQFVKEGHPVSQFLRAKDGKLFCIACKKFLALKRSTLDAHLGKRQANGGFSAAGIHHQRAIASQSTVAARRLDLTQAWQVYVADHPGTPGSTLEDSL
jgi:hypothetical protein